MAGCKSEHASTPLAEASAALDSLPAPPPLALSRFNVPLRYDFTAVLDIVNRVVPKKFGSLDSVRTIGDDKRKHYAYEAIRGPFHATATGKTIHLTATLSYGARGYYKPIVGPTLSAGCGGDTANRPRVVVELTTPLTLTDNWHLVSHAKLARLEAASSTDRDKCKVSVISYDVTQRVVDAARSALNDHLHDIDKRVGEVDLTGKFTEWWRLLNKPIHLADGVWLMLAPERLRLGEVSGSGTEVVVNTGLEAHPRIVTGPEPTDSAPPLPPLSHDTVSNGFNVMLEGVVDYATASNAMTLALRGKSVNEAGNTVTVQNMAVSPRPHGKLAVDLTFTGSASGALTLVGTPRYDPGTGELAVPDLDYDLNTDSKLIAAYAWLQSDALRTLLRAKARVPAKPLLDRGRELLLAGLNRKIGDAVTLSATVDSVDVAGIYVTKPGMVVRAVAAGQAGMSVKQKR